MSSPSRESTGVAPPAAARGRLREACFEDYDQIAFLESQFGLRPPSYAEWTHLWLQNPVYHAGKWPIGWVVDVEGRVVASVGNIPLPYEFGGEPLVASSGRALVADPGYRGAAMPLLDRVINQSGVDLYLNSTVTAESTSAFALFECRRVPAGAWDFSAFWVTHYRGFARSVLAAKGLPAFCTFPLAAGLSIKDQFRKKPVANGKVPVDFCSAFDQRFDTFWQAFRSANPNRLLAVRSCQVLDWHFFRARLNRQLWIVTVSRGRSLTAYAIFDRRDNPNLSLRRVRLVDFVSLDGSLAMLGSILRAVLDRCDEEQIHILETTGAWLEPGDYIDRIVPYKRRLSTWIYFYRANTRSLSAKLADAQAWLPSLYDGNASL
jgi:hypothetical protein